ncbi:MAG: hypothetical protein A3B23_01010 [Candidatus Colwellbacteria bacterium RIFCSPLOWO2_01_FULL_48_10]|uniref:SCP domain-containing protein n=2 Tax=Bacteria candidate phyla TaxID=1783234 RepID=A0A1F5P2Q6_9BACT|nr:MAG: hypothetical protein A2846_04050 [Candidatus Doudnabacteria bacterium RIFCSPHIGHO2_01_FULL_49_9]OGY59522.1 MAG: hypothetical protein A3B23_01010 [Candidatus Colwellbacteria bacterium RIFCSPLOWO2_01_FULL_48_10]
MIRKIVVAFGWIALAFVASWTYIAKPDPSRALDWLTGFAPKVSINSLARSTVDEIIKQISAPPPIRSVAKPKASSLLTASGIIAETNKERVANGLPLLVENFRLASAAAAKVDDMFVGQYFEHVSPSGAGPADLADNAGYEYVLIGENLALGHYAGDIGVVDAWMNSPGHRANILQSRYTEIGVSVKKGIFEGQETWLAVQEFGKPLSSCPAIDVVLKVSIEENRVEIDRLDAELIVRRDELENYHPKRGDEYNRKADEYNGLVAEYNLLIEKTKSMVAEYNRQVEVFNACAKN